jgi:acyl carrier protein
VEEDFVSLDDICEKESEVNQTEEDQEEKYSLSEVKEYIKKILFDILFLNESDEFDECDAFMELGMNSIYMVKFITQLNTQLALQLDETVLFEYFNAKDLAEYIYEKMKRGEQ